MKCLRWWFRNSNAADLYLQYEWLWCSVLFSAPPKVTNIKIVGDLRENSKITATGIVTGGTEGSSRVQWYKTCSSTLEENSLEALSTSKIAKVGFFFFSNTWHHFPPIHWVSIFCWVLTYSGIPHTSWSCWLLHCGKIYAHDSWWWFRWTSICNIW